LGAGTVFAVARRKVLLDAFCVILTLQLLRRSATTSLGLTCSNARGCLTPTIAPSAGPFANVDKADDHTWCAFATRAGVLVVNTKLVKAEDRPRSVLELTQPKWKAKVVMAEPQSIFSKPAGLSASLP
jgi:Bacterial extracellular solute-binding protein